MLAIPYTSCEWHTLLRTHGAAAALLSHCSESLVPECNASLFSLQKIAIISLESSSDSSISSSFTSFSPSQSTAHKVSWPAMKSRMCAHMHPGTSLRNETSQSFSYLAGLMKCTEFDCFTILMVLYCGLQIPACKKCLKSCLVCSTASTRLWKRRPTLSTQILSQSGAVCTHYFQ